MGGYWSESRMATRRPESPDSGASLKSDQSKGQPIDFKDRVSVIRPDFSSSEEDDVSDDGFFESPDDQRATGSMESIDSGVSFKNDGSTAEPVHFKEGVSPRRATGSTESSDSGVSLKSDQSKGQPIDFKDRVSHIRSDFSSSEEDDVSDDGFFESPDDQPEDDILPYMYPWADDCDWMELADNLEEMNQELSSEVGWKHG